MTDDAMLKCRKYRLSMSSSGETVKLWGYYAAGAVVQKTDYYPYGSPMTSSTAEEVNRYKFGEKEYETRLGLNFHNFEARMLFNDRLAFNRPDDLAGDTPWLSPYIYCAANPIKYIDPTGKEITINGEIFNLGVEYTDKDAFFMECAKALNTIAECGGKDVISDLINSETTYNYVEIADKMENPYTCPMDGNIEIGLTVREWDDFCGSVAHESFHGVQFENGQGGRTIFNEIEAYTFQYIISENSAAIMHPNMYCTMPAQQSGFFQRLYEQSMFRLMNPPFSQECFDLSIRLFKMFSPNNSQKIYDNFDLMPLNQNPKSMLLKYNPWDI